MRTCTECLYYYPFSALCRRYPPSTTDILVNKETWWCGEFKEIGPKGRATPVVPHTAKLKPELEDLV